MIGLSLADLIFEVFCFAATPSFRGVTTIVSKARQAVKDASSSSAELARDRSDLGKRVTDALTTKVKAAREQSLDRGIDTCSLHRLKLRSPHSSLLTLIKTSPYYLLCAIPKAL